MSPEVDVAGPIRAGEPLSLGPPPGLGVLAATTGLKLRDQPTVHVVGSVFCEECGAHLTESTPRCEFCDWELGGECGP